MSASKIMRLGAKVRAAALLRAAFSTASRIRELGGHCCRLGMPPLAGNTPGEWHRANVGFALQFARVEERIRLMDHQLDNDRAVQVHRITRARRDLPGCTGQPIDRAGSPAVIAASPDQFAKCVAPAEAAQSEP